MFRGPSQLINIHDGVRKNKKEERERMVVRSLVGSLARALSSLFIIYMSSH